MGYSVVNVAELEPGGPGRAVRFVRRALGSGAFGINWFEIPPNTEGREHDELETGQEEVNVIVAGSGRYRIDGEEIDAPAGTIVFVRDPALLRAARATADDTTIFMVGGPAGVPYTISRWETSLP